MSNATTKTKHHAALIDRKGKTAHALLMRRQGRTYGEIAQELGVSLATARKYVEEEFNLLRERCAETAEEVVQRHFDRLEDMYSALQDGIRAGNTRSIETAVKVLERQSRLLGLDAPTRQEVSMEVVNLSDQELVEQAKRMRVIEAQVVIPQLLPGEESGQ